MAFQFRFPDVGEGIAEGTLVKWKIKVGETIKEDQALADIETAKALVEIPSPKSGTILQIHAQQGAVIHVGDILVTIGEAGENIDVPSQKMTVQQIKKENIIIPQKQQTPQTVKEIRALPAARQKAKELGVDISSVKGSGKEGLILPHDVVVPNTTVSRTTTTSSSVGFDKFGRIMTMPLTGIRKTIAETMVRSTSTIPQVTHMDEVDITRLETLRQSKKEYAENKGIHLTMLPFIMKATVSALKAFPYLNSSFDAEKQAIIIKEYYNLGFAVDTVQGLLVPVIKNADTKSVLELAKKIEVLATHCKDRDIPPEDLTGTTFTFTNIGSYGGTAATPLILPGTCAILGIYRMKEKPVVMDGCVVIRKILPLSITFDHRIIDGGTAAQFMNTIIKHLEDTELFSIDA